MKKQIIFLFCLLILGCKTDVSPENVDSFGKWGGKGVELEVIENNSYFEMDCASATINTKLKTNGNEVAEQFGTYTYERGGPISVDEKPDLHPAKFRGLIEDDSMKVVITILDQKRADIILKMKRNENGLVFKCK